MLVTRLSAAATLAADDVVAFDTVVAKTNNNAALIENAVQISVPGTYLADLRAVLSSTSAAVVDVQLMEQGAEVEGAVQTVDVPANGTATVALQWPVRVIAAESGVASLSFTVGAAVTVDSAILTLTKVI